MNLLDKQYNRRSEEKTEENLNKAENQIAALSQYTQFLMQKKHEKAKEHLEKVEKLEKDITKVWDLFNKNAHTRSAAPPASPAAAHRPPLAGDGQIKLVIELKPETLAHDAPHMAEETLGLLYCIGHAKYAHGSLTCLPVELP